MAQVFISEKKFLLLLNTNKWLIQQISRFLHTQDFREKNTDHMRPDIVALLKSSRNAFIGGLIGIDPVATFRWAVLRAYCRAVVAFREAGKRHTEKKSGELFVLVDKVRTVDVCQMVVARYSASDTFSL